MKLKLTKRLALSIGGGIYVFMIFTVGILVSPVYNVLPPWVLLMMLIFSVSVFIGVLIYNGYGVWKSEK